MKFKIRQSTCCVSGTREKIAKSGRAQDVLPSMPTFNEAFKPDRLLFVGGDGISVDEFLRMPLESWIDNG